MTYISRRFLITKDNHEEIEYQDIEFLAHNTLLVILGEPGAGKTEVVRTLSPDNGNVYIRASALNSLPSIKMPTPPAKLIIDGIDEVTAYKPQEALIAQTLGKIPAGSSQNIILTCRAVDWQHAVNSSIIQHRFPEFVVGKLQPLNDKEICDFIRLHSNIIQGNEFLAEARKRGVTDLLRNPQTLLMLLNVVEEYGWPDTRKELYEGACRIMLSEDNDVHASLNISRPSIESLFDAAGFIFVQMILSGASGVNTDGGTVENFTNVAELEHKNCNIETIRSTLSTKVFRAVGKSTVEPCHRTIAEYLAARWLAKNIHEKSSLRRIEVLLYGEGHVVPSALRGLHAWLATHSSVHCNLLISRDPFGFFRYGDPATLTVDQSKHMLGSLASLSEEDPYFRTDDWGVTFNNGLDRLELQADILKIINNSKASYQLSHMVLESLKGSLFIGAIAEDLSKKIFNVSATSLERHEAAEVLLDPSAPQPDWGEIVDQLYTLNDVESLRIALYITEKKVSLFTGKQIATILIRLSEMRDRHSYAGLGYSLKEKMSSTQIEEALDILSKTSEDAVKGADQYFKDIEGWICKFTQELLARDIIPDAEKLWFWVKNIDKYSYQKTEWDNFSKEFFTKNKKLKRDMQRIALDKPANDRTFWMMLHDLRERSVGLCMSEEDIIIMMNHVTINKTRYNDWQERWQDLVRWAQAHRGFTGKALQHAEQHVKSDPLLQNILDDVTRPPEKDYEKEHQKIIRKEQVKRKAKQKARHKNFKSVQEKIIKGEHKSALSDIAKAYLGGYYYDITSDDPYERIVEMAGKDIADVTEEALRAAVSKDDVPTTRQMSELRAKESKCYFLEEIAVAHCAILASRGGNLEKELGPDLAASALSACIHKPVSEEKGILDIQPMLEKIVFGTKGSKEQFLRDMFEPFLEAGDKHIFGLYRFMREPEFSDVSGNLALEWIRKFPKISNSVLKELLTAAVLYGNKENLVGLVRDKMLQNDCSNDEQKSAWMGIAFLVDFEYHENVITSYAAQDKNTLWPIREMAFPDRDVSQNWPKLTLQQSYFLVSQYGPLWPPKDHPIGGWSGNTNPWDAYQLISTRINAIAEDMSDEAHAILKRCIAQDNLKGYQPHAKHVFAQQTRNRAEEYRPPITLKGVRDILCENEPANIDDLQAIIMNELEMLQRRLRDGQTTGINLYWDGNKPHRENYCRDRIIDGLETVLEKYNIRCHKEGAMPDDKRCDFLNTFGSMNLPVEVKGQWHNEVWTAGINQLKNYTRDYHAEGRGIYLVLWFGNVPHKNPPTLEGKVKPQSAEEMIQLLREQMPELSDKTKLFVLDLSRSD